MKWTFVLSYGLIACCVCIIQLACENPDLRDSHAKDENVIFRTDCIDCSECCCAVILDEDDDASLHLCGTADGTSMCLGTDICGPSPDNGGQVISLDTNNERQVFCMLEDAALKITNTSSTDDADIIITCQYDSGLPQLVPLHLEPLSTVYYSTDGSCDLTICD